ncbi:MAG: lysophospholipid acyltransferase family protein [Phycisphaeraceae bacterium]
MARNQSPLVNWSQYLALRLATMAMHTFPVERNLKSAVGLGSLLYRHSRRHRERAHEHLRMAMPDLPEARIAEIAECSMQHFLKLGTEVMFTTRLIQQDTWAHHVHLHNLQESLDLVLSDRPTILVTGHYGNWEVLGYVMGLLGIDLSAIARPIDNPLVNRWLLGVRERRGMRIITKFGATDSMVDVLENGGTLAFIADQNAGNKGMFVPFFDRLASTYKSIGLLALRYNAPVICGYARRWNTGFGFDVGTTDIIRPEDWQQAEDPLFYLTARYTRAIETMIREDPQQYLWLHRRWKSKPRFERLGKPMPDGLRQQLLSLPWLDENDVQKLQTLSHRPQ